jgi:hypothetical protein
LVSHCTGAVIGPRMVCPSTPLLSAPNCSALAHILTLCRFWPLPSACARSKTPSTAGSSTPRGSSCRSTATNSWAPAWVSSRVRPPTPTPTTSRATTRATPVFSSPRSPRYETPQYLLVWSSNGR